MPTTDAEEQRLFPQSAQVNPPSNNANSGDAPAPPSRRVARPSTEVASDVIRHRPTARAGVPTPRVPELAAMESVPVVPSDTEIAAARAEFAAAAARARAAVAEQEEHALAQQARQQAAAAAAPMPMPMPMPAPPQTQKRVEPSRPRIPQPRAVGQHPIAAAPPVPARAPVSLIEPAAVLPVPTPVQARVSVESEPEPRPTPASAVVPSVEEERAPRRASGESFLLHTRGLKKVYNGRAVVNDVEVTVRPSEIVGLLGPNGAGKTTSFYMIVGLVQPNGGTVMFDGNDATHEPMYRRARLGMGYLPQEESIFRKLSVEDNILAVMETQDVPRSERRDRCQALLRRFGIERLAKNEAITLSGGEKRRLTIARSLVTNPKLLMLDEPFSGVDPIAVGEIQDIVRGLREQGLAILITDHNVRETLDIVDRAYLLFEGQVKREGTRDFLINDPLSRKLYLGEQFSM